MASAMRPAQFFMIGIPGSPRRLLRRPYSVLRTAREPLTTDSRPARCRCSTRCSATGTRLLASLSAGARRSRCSVRWALGFERARRRGDVTAGVRGGGHRLGAVSGAGRPRLRSHPIDGHVMFYGARTAGELPLREWFRDSHTQTLTLRSPRTDGSLGAPRPRDASRWPSYLAQSRPGVGIMHLRVRSGSDAARGANGMALEHGAPCELALEAHMACGFGVCLGCVDAGARRGQPAWIRYDRMLRRGSRDAGRAKLAW